VTADLGDALLQLAKDAEEELLLVAPFVKTGALGRVLDAWSRKGTVSLVTRWRLEEIAAGVSDLGVYPMIRSFGGRMALHPTLHAKYYATGDRALMGSANLTLAALGWREDGNLELLMPAFGGRLRGFERDLDRNCIVVDDEMFESFNAALEVFPSPPVVDWEDTRPPSFVQWRPLLRHPEDLYVAYGSRAEGLSTSSKEAAALDLAALRPPLGLSREQFDMWVGAQLRQHPEAMAIDAFVEAPRRFGEMRDMMLRRGAEDGGRAWQQWMRWLLHFLGDRYVMRVANYSEIFGRRHFRAAHQGKHSAP